jgi:hypothetical protein
MAATTRHTYILQMDDGREVVAKVPSPNTGLQHYTTASEVATVDFLCLDIACISHTQVVAIVC